VPAVQEAPDQLVEIAFRAAGAAQGFGYEGKIHGGTVSDAVRFFHLLFRVIPGVVQAGKTVC
jgi:hypothetical protein